MAVIHCSFAFLVFTLQVLVTTASPVNSTCAAVQECINLLDSGRECQILPVPPRSLLPPVGPSGFRLEEIRKGVFAYYDGSHYALMIAAGRRFAFIDFPDSAGSNKPDGSMTRVTDAAEMIIGDVKPERIDMIYSHSHFDHIGSSKRFFSFMKAQFPNTQFVIWGTRLTRESILASRSRRAIVPTNIIGSGRPVLKISDDIEVQMEIQDGHTERDVSMYIPRKNGMPSIMMFIDLVFPGWSPFVNLALTENFREYEEAHRTLLKKDIDVFLGGHGLIGNKYSIRTNLRFVKDLRSAAAEALSSVTPQDFADGGIQRFSDPSAREFGNLWFAAISVIRGLQIDRCYRIVLEKWGCTLAGLDITLRSHCDVAISFVGLDD